MRVPALLAAAICVLVAIELVLPGRSVYHAGWSNVALAALAIWCAAAARKRFAKAPGALARWAIVVVAFGAGVSAFAGVVSGVFAADTRTIVGAPGERVHLGEIGAVLVFPLAERSDDVRLVSSGNAVRSIGTGWSDVGSAMLRTQPRQVVAVDARTLQGGHLTVTQPTGSVFLSPVLLMQQRQQIAGMNLPYDSFAVPAAHRIVKAVLFTPQEAATLRGAAAGAPAVLFAVDDEEDRPLPHAIALASDDETVALGGLRLRPTVTSYPAVDIVAAPSLPVVAVGVVLVAAGIALLAVDAMRRRKAVTG